MASNSARTSATNSARASSISMTKGTGKSRQSSAAFMSPGAFRIAAGSVSSGNNDPARIWEPDYSGKYIRRASRVDENDELSKKGPNFDPYQHRKNKPLVSNFGCTQHVIKGSVGLGVLALPLGFLHAGLIVGTLGTLFFGGVVSYGVNLLIKTELLLCKRKRVGYLSYSQAMQYAMEEGPDWMIRWAKQSRLVVNIFMAFSQVLFCCIYARAAANNVKIIIDEYYCEMFSLRQLMCILFLAFVLVSYVPNLKIFVYFSTLANVMMYTVFGWISYYMFTQEPSPGRRTYIGHPTEWVFFVGICLFAMQSIAVHANIEAYMERPRDFVGFFGVMNLSMAMITVTYWFIGFCGYWVYGEDTQANLMSHLPDNSTMTRSILVLQALVLLISFRLNSFSVINILLSEFFVSRQERMTKKIRKCYNFSLITGFCVISFALAMAIIDYIGAVATIAALVEGSMLVVGFPALMELCYLWPDNFGRYSWIFYKDLGMFAFSLIVLGMGFYVTVIDIINTHPAVSCASNNTTSS